MKEKVTTEEMKAMVSDLSDQVNEMAEAAVSDDDLSQSESAPDHAAGESGAPADSGWRAGGD